MRLCCIPQIPVKMGGFVNISVVLLLTSLVLHTATSSETEDTSVTEEQLMNVLKATEFHYEHLKRNLEEMDRLLKVAPLHRSLSFGKHRISKRSEVSQLFTSFLAFCENLQNENGTVPTKPDRPTSIRTVDATRFEPLEPRHTSWYTRERAVVPLKIKARQHGDRLILIFTVRHSVPAYALSFINMFHQQPVKKMRLSSNDRIPKISKARFVFNTKQRCSDRDGSSFKSREFMQFGEVGESYKAITSLSINVCSLARQNMTASTSVEEEITLFRNNWTVANETVIVDNRKNFVFQVELMPANEIDFSLETLGFNMSSDTLSKSFWDVYGSEENNNSYSLRARQIKELGDGNMTVVEIVAPEGHNCSDTYISDTQLVKPPIRLEITMDTDSGSNTGVAFLSQKYHPGDGYEGFIAHAGAWFPLYLKRQRSEFPIPKGKFLFHNTTKFLCNTNPAAGDKFRHPELCMLECQVTGTDIVNLIMYKANQTTGKRLPASMRSYTQVSPNREWAKAVVINTGEADKSLEGDYICEVQSRQGMRDQIVSHLMVEGYPNIASDGFTLERKDKDIARVTCSATGSGLNISIYLDERLPETRLDNNKNYSLSVAFSGQNELSYNLEIPIAELRYPSHTLICVASNDVGEVSSYIYTNQELEQLSYDRSKVTMPYP